MGRLSWDAIQGKPDDVDQIADTDDIEFPAGTGHIRISAAATTTGSSKVVVADANVGDLIKITGASGGIKLKTTAFGSVSADDQIVIKTTATLAEYDFIVLQRQEFTNSTTGVTYECWAKFIGPVDLT